MLISTSELNSMLNDPDVIIADTRSFKEYSEGHIPGSVHLDLFAFHWIDTTKQGIDNFNDQARRLFSFLGVTTEKKIVFYDSVSGMLAARGCLDVDVFFTSECIHVKWWDYKMEKR